jgi:hypothetical protein
VHPVLQVVDPVLQAVKILMKKNIIAVMIKENIITEI